MNNTSSNNIRDIHTFSELCKSWRIRIPKIQRDYVQGRKTSTVDDRYSQEFRTQSAPGCQGQRKWHKVGLYLWQSTGC